MKSFLIIVFGFFILAFPGYSQNITRDQYVDGYKNIAISEMKRTGVPASITLAQGILETNSGNSTLARKANNHFGIKCHSDWKGKTFTHDDDRPNECFRKYKSPEHSFKDHSDFLQKHQRYASLFELKTTDYKGWAHGLRKAGYATNKKYATLLIQIIESEKLYRFDSKKYKQENTDPAIIDEQPQPILAEDVDDYAINPFSNEIETDNRIDYLVVKDGDTYEAIADRQGVMVWQLLKYNERTRGAQLIEGERLYLQPKRKKADVKYKRHTIQPGENMYIISQKYGVKIKSLYKINNIELGREPEIGYTLSLRKKKK